MKVKLVPKKNLSFKKAVEATNDIAKCYQTGLRALGKYAAKVYLNDTAKCYGSIDIDACTSKLYPHDNRWDYAICYEGEVYFAEVHSANTGEVSTVIRKLQWLKDWLVSEASEINRLKVKSKQPFYWIQSNGFHILPNSPQARKVAQSGIRPIAILHLS